MSERRFIEQFEDNVRLYPEKVMFQTGNESITFEEVEVLSGRVYSYLQEHGYGKEDLILINLPHGINPHVVAIGVWKVGAAVVFTTPDFPKERIEYIVQECGCKLIVDSTVWDEMKSSTYLSSHNKTSVHDIAYIVYTSGSEGTPKGVIQEYGKLDFIPSNLIELVSNIDLPSSTIMYSYLPMSTVGTIANITMAVCNPMTVDLGSLEIMKNLNLLNGYFHEHKITLAFMPPSFFAHANMDSSYLKCVYFASEKASDIYTEKYTLVNLYIQSEGYHLMRFVLDKKYSNTPIGIPVDGSTVSLWEDDHVIVGDGICGELCYKNPFFRGYVNGHRRTIGQQESEFFHSGDIAKRNEDGNYVILGRKTDMIKINGNRIEPAEIEAAVKRVLNLDWAFAKGFVEPERSFICVYYTADINIDYAHVREELMKILPTYMIPSYFVHIDSIPHLPNGKVDRQAFKAPEVADYIADYIPPTNELEERLCTSMQQVLGVERIGINDDFYLLGGDSLRTIRLVALCDIEGLNVSDIYTSRTPSRIAERWIKKQIMNN